MTGMEKNDPVIELTRLFNQKADPDAYRQGVQELQQKLKDINDPDVLRVMLAAALGELEKGVAERLEDQLTGLVNRRSYDRLIADTMAKAEGTGKSFALLLFDIDHFKSFNDTHGHATGDDVLRIVASRLKHGIRTTDIAARYGGEEMVVILPETTLHNAGRVAEKLRQDIASAKLFKRGSNRQLPSVTVSVGLAASRAGESPDDLFARADGALYQAKNSGRNKVVTGPELPVLVYRL